MANHPSAVKRARQNLGRRARNSSYASAVKSAIKAARQAVDKGDIRFFEVAHLEVEIKQDKGRKVTVALKDFAFPYADLISEEVRSKIKKWSDYIDYWAVDWNFQNDTFMNGWVAYRTRKERKLPLASDANVYDKPGKYTIMVKVVDIFGNDTSQIFQTDVK